MRQQENTYGRGLDTFPMRLLCSFLGGFYEIND